MITKFFNLFKSKDDERREDFIDYFGLAPERLSEEQSKKEALLKLLVGSVSLTWTEKVLVFKKLATAKGGGMQQMQPPSFFILKIPNCLFKK